MATYTPVQQIVRTYMSRFTLLGYRKAEHYMQKEANRLAAQGYRIVAQSTRRVWLQGEQITVTYQR